MRSSWSMGIPIQDAVIGALNVYGTISDAGTVMLRPETRLTVGHLFADRARASVAASRRPGRSRRTPSSANRVAISFVTRGDGRVSSTAKCSEPFVCS